MAEQINRNDPDPSIEQNRCKYINSPHSQYWYNSSNYEINSNETSVGQLDDANIALVFVGAALTSTVRLVSAGVDDFLCDVMSYQPKRVCSMHCAPMSEFCEKHTPCAKCLTERRCELYKTDLCHRHFINACFDDQYDDCICDELCWTARDINANVSLLELDAICQVVSLLPVSKENIANYNHELIDEIYENLKHGGCKLTDDNTIKQAAIAVIVFWNIGFNESCSCNSSPDCYAPKLKQKVQMLETFYCDDYKLCRKKPAGYGSSLLTNWRYKRICETIRNVVR